MMIHVIPFMGQMFEIIWMSKVAICNRHILAIVFPLSIIYLLVLMIYTLRNSPLYKGLTFKGVTGIIVPILYLLSICVIAKCLEIFRRKMLQWQGHHRIFKIIDGLPIEGAVETHLPSEASPTIKERVYEVSGVKLSDVKIIDEDN